MAAQTRAKKFEQQFRADWSTYVPDSMCYRLNDQVSGFKNTSANVSDFINYKYPFAFLIDCKSHGGNTVSFSDFAQYDRMMQYKDVTGLISGTVIWFCDHDKIVWVPIETWEKIKLEGKKSFNIKMLDDTNYECLEIPSKKKRVFLESNYSALIDYYKEKQC